MRSSMALIELRVRPEHAGRWDCGLVERLRLYLHDVPDAPDVDEPEAAKGSQLTVVLNGAKVVDVKDTKHADGPIALQYGAGHREVPERANETAIVILPSAASVAAAGVRNRGVSS